MKILLAILVLIAFALSFLADYKWRRWMAKRRAEHTDRSDLEHGQTPR